MDFHGIDLNLLVAFDALTKERNVTRAAEQVGVSQPAMSAALSRLRKLFGDPLFLRSVNGLLPTPRARDLAVPIAQALGQIESALVTKQAFDPGNASVVFKLGLSDYPAFILLPSLLKSLASAAPNVSLNVYAFNNRDDAVDLLDAGAIDAAVGVPPTHTDGRILHQTVMVDDFVTILANGHPAARRSMSMKTYLGLQHVLVSPEGELYGLVDHALAQLGQKRSTTVTLPQMFAVPGVVAKTNLTATILKRVATYSAANRKLVLFPPPVALPTIEFALMWHRREGTNPAQLWFRQFITTHAATL